MARTSTKKSIEVKNFNRPDERRVFPKGSLKLLNLGGACVGRVVLEPGWRWSDSLQSVARTELCMAEHLQYHVSGVLRVQMQDGAQRDCLAGDVSCVPEGHDAWVVGDEPVVLVDFKGLADFAKPAGRNRRKPC
ncbi:MAG: cupin domain-containing protein [Elusimicrobia bacterium]|nr:cupin domain-containing protein [Elusimicrobiota bacterium]